MPPVVALLNYISSGIFWRIFCQTGIFRGVFLHVINFAVRISEAAMKGVGDIIFHTVTLEPSGRVHPHTGIYRGFFLYYSPQGSAKLRWAAFFLEILDFLFLGEQRSCDGQGGGGAQRPVRHDNVPKKTGARSAQACTRGQNPLVNHIFS